MGENGPASWQNWAGTYAVTPTRIVHPRSPDQVAAEIGRAASDGLSVKAVGSGHSFTDIAVTRGVMIALDQLTGIIAADRSTGLVTVAAGTTLAELNPALWNLGLSLTNLGDIDSQTISGAIATGTHGTGGHWASLSAQVAGLEVVTGDGSLVQAGPHGTAEEAALFQAARLGLGAVGILTAVTFLVEPAFALEAVEEPLSWSEVVDGFDELVGGAEYAEAYWFPHTDRMLTKRNNRTLDDREPLSRARAYVDDELLANTAFGLLNRVGNRVPRAIPGINRLSSRALTARTYTDYSHRVFTSPRRVVFREMEYAVPRAAGMQALTEVRALVEQQGWRISFPVEVRHAPADDVWLSAAHDRPSVYLAFHTNAQTDHTAYFAGVERVLKAYDGRPHWGKLHTRTAEDLAPAYPRFADFLAVRDRVDPDRLFTNAYLDRVLGP